MPRSSTVSASSAPTSASQSEKLKELLTLTNALKVRQATSKLARYQPYAKQIEFHAAGAVKRERLLLAANRFGKTQCGAAEMAMHLTGVYPEWWTGKRFTKPVRAWAAGVTNESTRDVVQDKLIGPPSRREEWGTGFVPRSALVGDASMARGTPDFIDTISVKHASGGNSTLQFKSYERGREKWQGAALEVIWLDEECEEEIYTEALTRTNETGGIVFMTFTPLLGMSDVVMRFLRAEDGSMAAGGKVGTDHPDRGTIFATIDDAEHFTPEERARIAASYPAHEREARLKGIPVLGSGRVFPIEEDAITEGALDIPEHWPLIGGIDFGWDHPTAAVKIAWDRDADVAHVVAAYRVREATPIIHAAALKPWGETLPWSWPHDGLAHDKGSGDQLAELYRRQGLDLLRERATFEDGTNGLEAGLMMMLERMQTGRLKVARHLTPWFEEFRLYHRENGLVVKERDDLMAATRYALMMLRFAEPERKRRAWNMDGTARKVWA